LTIAEKKGATDKFLEEWIRLEATKKLAKLLIKYHQQKSAAILTRALGIIENILEDGTNFDLIFSIIRGDKKRLLRRKRPPNYCSYPRS
jgi:hypothetical protein